MDVLASVLGHTQLGNTMLCQSHLIAPWGLDIEPHAKTAVHIVQRGVCWLRVENDAPVRLVSGDVVLVARGLRHAIVDQPSSTPLPYQEVLEKMKTRVAGLASEHVQEATVLLCAAYEFEQNGQHPLLTLLPRLIHFNIDEVDSHGQFHALFRLLVHESTHRGSGCDIVVPRLVDSLFVYIVRAWLDRQPAGTGGWFGALRDPQIGRALGILHEQPMKDWSVEELADHVHLSRAAFARRFVELVGEPPLKYLTRWRMSLAAKWLSTTNESVETIASKVGYDSPTSFCKAFQRYLRTSPGRYRTAKRDSENMTRDAVVPVN